MRRAFFAVLAGIVLCADVLLALAQTGTVSPNPKDPEYQAKGDQHRTYAFSGGDPQTYRLYVPTKWNKDTKLPVLVLLSPAEVDAPWGRGNGLWVKVAEQRGYIVVTPSGYRPKDAPASWRPRYNNPFGAVPLGGGKPAVYDRDPRSEQDVLNVSDIVAQEYNADRSRMYLFSNSHGGAGVWYLGQSYPERWAAIAIASGPILPDAYPFNRLKSVSVLVVHGTHDETMSYDAAFRMVRIAKEKGVNAQFFPVLEGTHLESWTSDTAFGKILDFFDKNRKK